MQNADALRSFYSRVTPAIPELFNMAYAICGNYDLAEYSLQYTLMEAWMGEFHGGMGFREGLRNTLRRVEVAAPIRDEALQEEILSAFDVMLRDNCQAWNLCSDGVYRRNRNDQPKLNAQETFFQQAYDREQKAAAKK